MIRKFLEIIWVANTIIVCLMIPTLFLAWMLVGDFLLATRYANYIFILASLVSEIILTYLVIT